MNGVPGYAEVPVRWLGRQVRLEYQWIEAPTDDAPLMVFLHEGLGSVAMWKGFPRQLCAAGGFRGLVFSRPGYGRSTPRAPGEVWGVDFLHQQAQEVLPAFLDAVGVQSPVWLFGHSDGASIALLHAAAHPARVRGMVLLAPHIFVEDVTVQNIEKARRAYQAGDLRVGLARYHDDPDSAFWGWNRVWLDPDFRAWNIQAELAAVQAPVLAVQGLQDEYGSLAQIRGIHATVAGTQLLELDGCGHSPHRDRPDDVVRATVAFVRAMEASSCAI